MSTTVPELMTPGKGRGLLDVFRNRYLLRLLVDKEIQVRYRGTVLGLVWSYLKPAVQGTVLEDGKPIRRCRIKMAQF